MDTYKKNIELIKEMNEELGIRIDESKEDWLEVVKAKNGKSNLLVKKNMRFNLAYPEENPLKASKTLIKNYKFAKDTGTVLLGIGLGHSLKHLLKKKEKGHRVIVVEPVLYLIKLTLQNYDLTEELKDGTLFIATAREDVAFLVNFIDSSFVIQNYITITEQYVFWCEEYTEILPYTFEIINQHRCGIGTVMGAGNIIADNDIKNLPYVIRNRGVEEIRGLFKGKPAILVNTGPSLAKNIHLLPDIQDRVVIISVAQALRILLAYGITPDFICSVDYGEVNYEHFKGLMDSNVTLCCLNRTYAPILKEWQGNKFICCTPTPGFTDVTSILQGKGSLEQGGSVSHMNLGLAQHLGCDPIIDIGQDFAFNDGLEDNEELKSHIEQVDAGGVVEDKDGILTWKIKDPRSSLKKSDHSMGGTTQVPGYYGTSVTTNIGLASFITSFERMVRGRSERVIDATEGGCSMEGTEKITLQKCIDEIIPAEKVDKTILTPYLSLVDNSDGLIERAIRLLKEDIKNLEYLRDNTDWGLKIAEEIKGLIDEREKNDVDIDHINIKIDKLLKKNEYYSNKAQNNAKKNALVTVSIYHASRTISKSELNIRKQGLYKEENLDELNTRMKRNNIILDAANKTAVRLLECYNESLDILEKYLETKNESLLTTEVDEPISFDDAEDYFEAGNWAHVLVDCMRYLKIEPDFPNDLSETNKAAKVYKKAINMKREAVEKAKNDYIKDGRQEILDYNEMVDKAYKLGKDKNDIEGAFKLLEEANKMFPKRQEARWGLATVHFKLGNLDKSIEYYKELIKEHPENHKYRFEYGLALLQKDFDKGMETLRGLFAITDYYDFYLVKFADLYHKAGDLKSAITAYESYLEKFPGDYEAFLWLAQCYTEAGQKGKAKKMREKYERMVN